MTESDRLLKDKDYRSDWMKKQDKQYADEILREIDKDFLLKEALEVIKWYASYDNWRYGPEHILEDLYTPAEADKGERARLFLKSISNGARN